MNCFTIRVLTIITRYLYFVLTIIYSVIKVRVFWLLYQPFGCSTFILLLYTKRNQKSSVLVLYIYNSLQKYYIIHLTDYVIYLTDYIIHLTDYIIHLTDYVIYFINIT